MSREAKDEVLSISYAGKNHYQDASAKITHIIPDTTPRMRNRSVVKDGTRTIYMVPLHVRDEARLTFKRRAPMFFSLIMIQKQMLIATARQMRRWWTPRMEQRQETYEKDIRYLTNRELNEPNALTLVATGFFEPIMKEMQLNTQLNRLI